MKRCAGPNLYRVGASKMATGVLVPRGFRSFHSNRIHCEDAKKKDAASTASKDGGGDPNQNNDNGKDNNEKNKDSDKEQKNGMNFSFKASGQMSAKNSIHDVIMKSGKIGLITHFSMSVVWFSVIFSGIKYGVDVPSMIESIGFPIDTSSFKNVGDAAVAFILYKLIQPIRMGVTVVLTPLVMKFVSATKDEHTIDDLESKENGEQSEQEKKDGTVDIATFISKRQKKE